MAEGINDCVGSIRLITPCGIYIILTTDDCMQFSSTSGFSKSIGKCLFAVVLQLLETTHVQ